MVKFEFRFVTGLSFSDIYNFLFVTDLRFSVNPIFHESYNNFNRATATTLDIIY